MYTPLMEKIIERLGGPPLLLLSDGLWGYRSKIRAQYDQLDRLLLLSDWLWGYREGYNNTMGTEPRPGTMHIPDAAVNSRHVNNNRHERHNGDTERRKKGSRGFNSNEPGLFVLDEIYHNFLRPHMGLGGMTPAEKAGIHVPGPDKLLTLIRCAAASRFSFG